jgi:hypothetical protein
MTTWELKEACAFVLELAKVVQKIHKKQVQHRDLTPSNIFSTPLGPALVDFGLAFHENDPTFHTDFSSSKFGHGLFITLPEHDSQYEISPSERRDTRTDATFVAGILLYLIFDYEVVGELYASDNLLPHQRKRIADIFITKEKRDTEFKRLSPYIKVRKPSQNAFLGLFFVLNFVLMIQDIFDSFFRANVSERGSMDELEMKLNALVATDMEVECDRNALFAKLKSLPQITGAPTKSLRPFDNARAPIKMAKVMLESIYAPLGHSWAHGSKAVPFHESKPENQLDHFRLSKDTFGTRVEVVFKVEEIGNEYVYHCSFTTSIKSTPITVVLDRTLVQKVNNLDFSKKFCDEFDKYLSNLKSASK